MLKDALKSRDIIKYFQIQQNFNCHIGPYNNKCYLKLNILLFITFISR